MHPHIFPIITAPTHTHTHTHTHTRTHVDLHVHAVTVHTTMLAIFWEITLPV